MKLPSPNNDALEHSQKVTQFIADKIQQSGGAIAYSEYMEHVLYAPGLGYYSAGSTKFGEFGDFITAPEISSLFSQSIAAAIVPVLAQLTSAVILEVGAGSGKMAADILIELSQVEQPLDTYYILERSAELRARQQQTIASMAPTLIDKVQWLDSLPVSFSGVVIANELLDAMPVQRFKKKDDSIVELFVRYNNNQFSWDEVPCSNSRLASRVSKIESNLGLQLPEGYQSEVNFVAEDWLLSINDILEQGYILLLDYGYPEKEYYHEQRSSGTLSCFYQHRRHDDVFIYPGLQDITAHIDFTNLTDSVVNSKNNLELDDISRLQLNGYTTQSQFLMASGLMELMQKNNLTTENNIRPNSIKQQLTQSQAVKKLTMPYEMGEIVKVIGFEKGLSEHSDFDLQCFSMRDLRYQL